MLAPAPFAGTDDWGDASAIFPSLVVSVPPAPEGIAGVVPLPLCTALIESGRASAVVSAAFADGCINNFAATAPTITTPAAVA